MEAIFLLGLLVVAFSYMTRGLYRTVKNLVAVENSANTSILEIIITFIGMIFIGMVDLIFIWCFIQALFVV